MELMAERTEQRAARNFVTFEAAAICPYRAQHPDMIRRRSVDNMIALPQPFERRFLKIV